MLARIPNKQEEVRQPPIAKGVFFVVCCWTYDEREEFAPFGSSTVRGVKKGCVDHYPISHCSVHQRQYGHTWRQEAQNSRRVSRLLWSNLDHWLPFARAWCIHFDGQGGVHGTTCGWWEETVAWCDINGWYKGTLILSPAQVNIFTGYGTRWKFVLQTLQPNLGLFAKIEARLPRCT